MYPKNQKEIAKTLARELRKNSTKAERIFWEAVRNRNFLNKKFYRQHIIYFEYYGKRRFFIADFYCHEEKLVVELDGKIHLKQKGYDEIRSEIIRIKGIKVIRFKNEEIENDLNEALEKIKRVMGIIK